MAQAEISKVIDVDSKEFFKAVNNFEAYPEFVDGCKSVKVDRKSDTEARVTYNVSMMKEISYTLDHRADPKTGRIDWKLQKSDFLKKNEGYWIIKPAGPGKTEVKYAIEIEFNFPVPGLILNRLVKSSLPSMLASFTEKAGG
ncbi:MAG: SRPBCC family protein [Bdellovibrionota bacterium]